VLDVLIPIVYYALPVQNVLNVKNIISLTLILINASHALLSANIANPLVNA
jgi:hypothetical protein